MKIYFAGPDVFREDYIQYFNEVRSYCLSKGHDPLIPIDNEFIFSSNTLGSSKADLIYQANLKMIRSCDTVVCNVEPFRGASMDVGSAFEIGFARALNKSIVFYLPSDCKSCLIKNFNKSFKDRSEVLFKNEFASEVLNLERYSIIEDFDQLDNLMISRSSDLANTVVHGYELAITMAELLTKIK